MRRFIEVVGYVIAGLVVVVLLAFGVIYFWSSSRLARHYGVTARIIPIPSDPASVEHGRHLAVTRGCAECHGLDFGGAKVVEDTLLGTVYGPNLTSGRGGVTGGFTDENWVRAIRHGVAPDGRALFLMPANEFGHYSDDDVSQIVAYLKTLAPVDRDTVPIRLGPLGRVLVVAGVIKIAAEHIDHEHLTPDVTLPGVTADYGAYLAKGCVGCHGENYAGGRIPGAPSDWPSAANLTPDATTEISQWTEADFLQTMRTFRRPNGVELNPVMPRVVGQMTDDELKAIWLFLRTLPAVPSPSA